MIYNGWYAIKPNQIKPFEFLKNLKLQILYILIAPCIVILMSGTQLISEVLTYNKVTTDKLV